MQAVIIKLTKKQTEALLPLREHIQQAYDAGRPIAIIGQIDTAMERAGFKALCHEESVAIMLIMRPDLTERLRNGEKLMNLVEV
jgi:hypothetical protein